MTRRVDREGPIQRAIIARFMQELPGCVIAAVPNSTDVRGKSAQIAVAKQKQNGLLPGFPDLIVAWHGQAAFIEVKAPGGRLSEAQSEVLQRLASNMMLTAVIDTQDAVPAIAQAMRGNLKTVGDVT